MSTYDKQSKEEAVRLSDEIGVKKASDQLGIPYYIFATLKKEKLYRLRTERYPMAYVKTVIFR